jgi:ATP-binding cassette, subfamily B, bacterial HlyB/CyaB
VWDKLRFGREKHNSVADTVFNLSCFLPLPVRAEAIESAVRTQGMSYHLVAQTLEKFGYIVHTAKADFSTLRTVPLPALIGYGSRLAVLIEMRKDGAVLIDPVQGPLEVRIESLAEYWNEEVLTVECSGTEEEFSPWALVITMLKKRRQLAGSLFGLKSLILALSFTLPLLAGYTFDALKGGSSWAQLAGLAALGFLLRAVLASLDYLQDLSHAEIHRGLLYDLQRRFFRHVAKLKASTKASVGEISVYEHEFRRFVDFCTGTIVNSSFDVLAIAALSVLLARYSFWLLLIPLVLFAALVLTRTAFLRPLRALYQAHVQNQAEQRQMATAYIDGIAAVKASGSEQGLVRKFEGLGLAGWRLNMKAARMIQILEALIKLYSALAVTVSLYVSCQAYFAQLMSVGDVIALNLFMMMLTGHVQALGEQVAELEEIRVSLGKIRELFGRETVEDTKSASRQVSPALSGHIELKNVSFQFKMQDRPVLNDVSLTIYPRQTVAIVGKSGAGKSTLARLLTGDLEPTRGNIYYDGIDIRSLDNTCRRRDIGLVLQKSELFSGTIADNVAYGDDRPDENRIVNSLRKSAALALVEKQYKELDHYLAEGGVGLSGGEKQRIALARTYYRGARIMILDEATAALDANSEFEVVGRLKEALAERTGILIAHRFSTVQAADRIIVLHEGQVVEDGTHEELMQKNGFYSELFAEQLALAQGEGW